MTKLCNSEMRNLQLNFLCKGQGQKELKDLFEHVRKTTSPILEISPTLFASLCTCSPSNCTHHWWYSPPNLSQFPNIPSKTHGRPLQSPMPSAHQLSVRLSVCPSPFGKSIRRRSPPRLPMRQTNDFKFAVATTTAFLRSVAQCEFRSQGRSIPSLVLLSWFLVASPHPL